MHRITNIKNEIPDLFEGSFLLLIEPQHIPHLVYLEDGKYYSLTYKGVELGYSIAPYLEKLMRTQKALLFLEVNKTNGNAYTTFANYLMAGEDDTTCFYPIKELLLPESAAQMIHELIPDLAENKLIGEAYQVGMTTLLDKDGSFELSTYSLQDISEQILNLKKKYVEG